MGEITLGEFIVECILFAFGSYFFWTWYFKNGGDRQ